MLWLCLRLPQLAREAALAAHAAAPERRERRARIERAAIERLAAWAYQWSSLVSYRLADEALLWLEVGASAALFGGHAALLAKIEAELQQLGYSHVCALAPSPTGAALLTQVEQQRCVFTQQQLRARLECLPLSLLALPQSVLTALQASGLHSIGQVLALPAAAIARRFEPETNLYLQRLCAQASEPLPAWQLPPIYRARCEFGSDVHDTSALLFALRRLLLEFQGYLRARDCSVLRLTLQLEHYRRPTSNLTIGLSAPVRDAAQLLQLAHEHLQALTLPAPVSAVGLEALEFTSPSIVQADLFGGAAQQLQQLQLLLDRLRARLGDSQVHSLQCAADYRPERAWRLVAPEQARSASIDASEAARPCAVLQSLQRIDTPAALLSGPERIESGWWDGADAARDYYVARAEDGVRQWVFRDLHDGSWYLQGLWV